VHCVILHSNIFVKQHKMYNFSTLTQQQKTALQAVLDKWAAIAGSYEQTMILGIVHGYCDSGILTDAFSVDDAERVSKYFDEDAVAEGTLDEFNERLLNEEGKALDCCTAIAEIAAITEDVEFGAAYISSLLNVMQA